MLTTKEAAALIGCAPITLAKLRCTGGGPVFLKIGRAVRYARADIDAWLVTKRRANTSQI